MPKLGEEAETSSADIGGRRIEQRAVVGEWDMIEVIVRIVGVKRAPPAVSALHSDHPLCRPVNRATVSRRPEAVESESYCRRIVQIGVIGVLKLESPATGTQPRAGRCPVADHLEDLLTLEPIECRAQRRFEAPVTDLHQRVAG